MSFRTVNYTTSIRDNIKYASCSHLFSFEHHKNNDVRLSTKFAHDTQQQKHRGKKYS